jgi:hypothetical protein
MTSNQSEIVTEFVNTQGGESTEKMRLTNLAEELANKSFSRLQEMKQLQAIEQATGPLHLAAKMLTALSRGEAKARIHDISGAEIEGWKPVGFAKVISDRLIELGLTTSVESNRDFSHSEYWIAVEVTADNAMAMLEKCNAEQAEPVN